MEEVNVNGKIRRILHKKSPSECWKFYVSMSTMPFQSRKSIDPKLMERLKSFLRVNNYPIN